MARRERKEDVEAFDLVPEIEPEPRREAVGRQLQRAREELGDSLQDVSQELRIRYVYLHAIEQCRYDELPGPTYAVGFVRGYADYLGLPSEEIVRRFKEEMSGLPQGSALQFPVPKPEGRIPGLAFLVISLLLLALAYGGWYVWNTQGERLVELLPWPAGEEGRSPVGLPASSGETSAPTLPPTGEPLVAPMAPATQDAAAPREQPARLQTLEGAPSLGAPAYQGTAAAPGAVEQSQARGMAPVGTTGVPAPVGAAGVPAPVGAGTDSRSFASAVTPPTEGLASGGASEAASGLEDGAPEEPTETFAEQPAPTLAEEVGRVAAAAPEGALPESAMPESTLPGSALPGSTLTESGAAIPAPPPSGTPEELATSGHAYGAVNSNARIRITATADSWVQVRDAAQQPLFTQVLRPGDSYAVPNRPGLTLHTGNAGGLELAVDGTPLPALGPLGAVRRNIALDPDRLLSAEGR